MAERRLPVESHFGVAIEQRAELLAEVVLFGHAANRGGNALHGQKSISPLPIASSYCLPSLLEKGFRVLGNQTVLPGLVGHLSNARVVDVASGEALAQVLTHTADVFFIEIDVYFPQYLVHAPRTGCGFQHQLGQIFAIVDLTEYIEHFVTAQRLADLVEFVKEPLQDTPLTGVRSHQVENVHLFGLTVTVDTAHALFQAVGVPGQVVVDHQVAELEVDAFACSFRGYHDLGLMFELSLGLDPGL